MQCLAILPRIKRVDFFCSVMGRIPKLGHDYSCKCCSVLLCTQLLLRLAYDFHEDLSKPKSAKDFCRFGKPLMLVVSKVQLASGALHSRAASQVLLAMTTYKKKNACMDGLSSSWNVSRNHAALMIEAIS